MNPLQDYEVVNGKTYPVLSRRDPSSKCSPCPFCKQRHTHGESDGHRIAHCANVVKVRGMKAAVAEPADFAVLSNGQLVKRDDGYIVRTQRRTDD